MLAAEHAGGVAQVRLLDGNVGYLELAPLLFAPGVAGHVVGAAMTVLADTAALIIDVRRGEPVSHGNWEGVGVQPDVEVPDGDALEIARTVTAARGRLDRSDMLGP